MMIRARGRAAIETNVIKRRQTNDRDASEERGARPLSPDSWLAYGLDVARMELAESCLPTGKQLPLLYSHNVDAALTA